MLVCWAVLPCTLPRDFNKKLLKKNLLSAAKNFLVFAITNVKLIAIRIVREVFNVKVK